MRATGEHDRWLLSHVLTGWSHFAAHCHAASLHGVRLEADTLAKMRQAAKDMAEVLELQEAYAKEAV